jgi:uncharacterized membrane protein YqiK
MGEVFGRADKRGDAEAERQRQYEEEMARQEAALKAQQDALLASQMLSTENMTDNITKVEVGGGGGANAQSVSGELMADTQSKSTKKKRSTSSQLGIL